MKTHLFFIVLSLHLKPLWGQTNSRALKLDSLNQELARAKSDTDRVLIYNNLQKIAPTGKQGLGMVNKV
jgi:hypothetical protein